MIRWKHMNETKPTSRQQKILDFLAKTTPKTRAEIAKEANLEEKVSKITLLRDLNSLIDQGLLATEGKGRYVKYKTTRKTGLLSPVGLDNYFETPPDSRTLKSENFNFSVFSALKSAKLLNPKEEAIFEQGREKLTKKFKTLDPTIIRKELERFTIELSWKSSQIEGNTYSLLETEELIKNKKEAKGHSKEEALMILNHKEAFGTILEHKKDYREISLHDLRALHATLTKDLEIKEGLRKHAVGITGTKYIPLDNQQQITEALEKTLRLLKNEKSIPEKALLLLAMISYIQPFGDGNKRTSRMISNALLLANGYYPLSYRSVDEVEYKKALLLFYEQNNLFHLKRLFVEQQEFAVKSYFI
ncbi:cell filamentation protein Fic [candidate division WWE3 bacterium]|nr:cell filamentation protein Fic [candidate division WWE3 bacterium]